MATQSLSLAHDETSSAIRQHVCACVSVLECAVFLSFRLCLRLGRQPRKSATGPDGREVATRALRPINTHTHKNYRILNVLRASARAINDRIRHQSLGDAHNALMGVPLKTVHAFISRQLKRMGRRKQFLPARENRHVCLESQPTLRAPRLLSRAAL